MPTKKRDGGEAGAQSPACRGAEVPATACEGDRDGKEGLDIGLDRTGDKSRDQTSHVR